MNGRQPLVSNLLQRGQVAFRDLVFGVYHNLPISYGTPIFEREWDALIILDGCRPDTLASVADEYDFLPEKIESIYSVGSCSWEWMERNFAQEYRDQGQQTAYITANPYTDDYLDEAFFGETDAVWRYAWDEETGTVPARAVTDRAIAAGRQTQHERFLVHYMQPHFPSVPAPLAQGIDLDTFGKEWNSVWQRLEDDELSVETVVSSYRENLRYVLDDVELLLKNLDAERVVISADHANALGEWGLYGHPVNKPAPAIRRVPWVETRAVDENTHHSATEAGDDAVDKNVEQRLRDLGYR